MNFHVVAFCKVMMPLAALKRLLVTALQPSAHGGGKWELVPKYRALLEIKVWGNDTFHCDFRIFPSSVDNNENKADIDRKVVHTRGPIIVSSEMAKKQRE